MPVGRTDPGLAMEHMILTFRMRPRPRSTLAPAGDQQDPGSPRYHQWLTPGSSPRPSDRPDEIDTVSVWLKEQGFTLDGGARRMTLTFTGTAAQVEQAFRRR